jgi:hypothetical protein
MCGKVDEVEDEAVFCLSAAEGRGRRTGGGGGREGDVQDAE